MNGFQFLLYSEQLIYLLVFLRADDYENRVKLTKILKSKETYMLKIFDQVRDTCQETTNKTKIILYSNVKQH